MYGFSKIVLEQAADALPTGKEPRILECIAVVHRYLNWISDGESASNYETELRHAVSELSGIALRHGQVEIAARLQNIAAN